MTTLTWKRVNGTLVSSDGQFQIKSTEQGWWLLFRNGAHFGHCIRQKHGKIIAQRIVDGLPY